MVAVASAAPQHQQAAKYPAGVDPSKCPNFPLCDNAALHNPNAHNQWNQPAQQWNAPAPQWNNNGQWNQHNNGQWNQQEDDGQYRPENEGQWNEPAQKQWNQPAAPQWNQWNSAPAYTAPANNHLTSAGGDK